jgi:hypothetical protein
MKSSTSIRTRLLNISRNENIPFQQILYRYFHERFIYRVSVSVYSNAFLLKGGNLLYVEQGLVSRPTKDIDFLAKGITNDISEIKNIFIEICKVQCPNDKVLFDPDSIDLMIISDQEKYSGLRVILSASFDTVKQKIQIDIAYGDIVTPKAQTIDYPVLLDEMPVPVISAYTTETLIAEKFQAMIELAGLNSRMKDFYDVYTLLEADDFDRNILKDAIIATFKNRNTPYTQNHSLFTDGFATDKNRKQMWKAFLKKINTKKTIPFEQVIQKINKVLKPIYNSNLSQLT